MGQADVFGLGDGLPRLRRGLRVTHLGDERLVLDPTSGVVHTVRGPAVRTLDAVLGGRPAKNDEVLAALTGAGIVELRGVGRRQALILAGSAAALVASVSLPSALAAASTFNLPAGTGGGSATTTEFTLASGHRLYRLFDNALSEANTSFRLTVTFPTTIEVLLVGGGGPGGNQDTENEAEFFGGGGGGGEVALINLGRVTAGSALDITVAGRGVLGLERGRSTTLQIGTDSAVALGGGRGAVRSAGTVTDASDGGSGGGGNPSNRDAGDGVSGALSLQVAGRTRTSSRANSGGAGTIGYRAAAGGGGAAGMGSTAGSTTAGGNGGNGISLGDATDWDLTVSTGSDPTAVQNILGAGGGGAGAVSGGTSNASSFDLGDGGFLDGSSAKGGVNGPLASGGGGGGGIEVTVPPDRGGGYSNASAGTGGPGVVWVRTIS